MAQRIDVHQAITDRIVAATDHHGDAQKGYRRINVVSLWVEAQREGYAVPVWGSR